MRDMLVSVVAGFPLWMTCAATAADISDVTHIVIEKAWSQEPGGWTYPVSIRMPSDPAPEGGYAACILLHGNGGTGEPMLWTAGELIECRVLIAPSGYDNSWNLCAEDSNAPDLEMLEELIAAVQAFDNINPNRIGLMGFSNGAGLTNRYMVEGDASGMDRACAVVSQLFTAQHHEGGWWGPSGETEDAEAYCGYDDPQQPVAGRKYLSICNENDPIIPYHGGESVVGVTFLPAPAAIFEVAKMQGYTGEPIMGEGEEIGDTGVYGYSYLDGDIVHLRGYAEHAIDETQEAYITAFFGGCDAEACPADLSGDGEILVDDVLLVLEYYGQSGGEGDVDGSGLVDVDDLLVIIGAFGENCS